MEQSHIIEHVRELRQRLVWAAIAFISGLFLCYIFAQDIYQFLVTPLADAYSAHNTEYGSTNRRMIFTGLTEAFFTYLKLAAFGGFIIAFPILATQAYFFISPGLYKNEKQAFLPFLITAPLLFILGSAMVYYILAPLAFEFFLSFEVNPGEAILPVQLEPKISEYLSLMMQLIIAFGIGFQMPLILVLLIKSGIIKIESLKKGRRYAVIIFFIISALMTPPDPMSQIILALPLIGMYEITIFLASKKLAKTSKIREQNA